MKRVVFFVTTLDSGGLENYLYRFLNYKGSEFKEIIVYCKGGKGGELEELYKSISNVKIVKNKIGYFNIFDYYNLYIFFKLNQIDVVCDFTGNFAAIPLLVAKIGGVKNRLVFFRKDTNIFGRNRLKLLYNYFLNKLLLKVSTKVLSNSRSALNFFFKEKWATNQKFAVIYNGINAQKFLENKDDIRGELNIQKSAFVIGHVGRYNPAKNHDAIIKVATKLCKDNEDIYFIICGKNTDVYLRNIVFNNDLDDKIKVLGLRNDVVKVLNSLDCFYFPSLSEGQPNALIEAMIVGIPFVASNIEPNKETVPKEYFSHLIDPNDTEGAIDKILEIKKANIKRDKLLSSWSKENYNPDKLFEKFYLELKA